jgi:hypothetical protein
MRHQYNQQTVGPRHATNPGLRVVNLTPYPGGHYTHCRPARFVYRSNCVAPPLMAAATLGVAAGLTASAIPVQPTPSLVITSAPPQAPRIAYVFPRRHGAIGTYAVGAVVGGIGVALASASLSQSLRYGASAVVPAVCLAVSGTILISCIAAIISEASPSR